jgi:hypothetical protein
MVRSAALSRCAFTGDGLLDQVEVEAVGREKEQRCTDGLRGGVRRFRIVENFDLFSRLIFDAQSAFT